jgi:hypothetical protein
MDVRLALASGLRRSFRDEFEWLVLMAEAPF